MVPMKSSSLDSCVRRQQGIIREIRMSNKQRTLLLGAISLFLVFSVGCASRHAYLVPAPTANLTSGGHAVMASADGVTITVTPNSWNGIPHNLYKHLTPLEVRIENHSNQPIRLVYADFKLVSPGGKTFAALPPSEITGTQYEGENRMPGDSHFTVVSWQRRHTRPTRVIITPSFYWSGFYFAPYWNYGYVGIGPWPYSWGPPFGYYHLYYPYMRAIHLPTRSMLQKGIPEGVISAGGYVQGFFYFEKVDPNLKEVDFIATLQEARTGRKVGTIRIPFQVQSRSEF